MNNQLAIIKINGQIFTLEKLALLISEKLSSPDLPDWEVEFFTFLKEWFSDSDTICAQTSGSTGEPTTIELHKSVMVKSARRTIEYFGLQAQNRILLSLPCRFIAGKMMVVRAIVGKMDLVTLDPTSDFEILLTDTFDFGAMVPNQVFKLLENDEGKQKLENIRNLLIGGSAIPSTRPTRSRSVSRARTWNSSCSTTVRSATRISSARCVPDHGPVSPSIST